MENSTSQISKLDHGKEGLRTFCILTQSFLSTQFYSMLTQYLIHYSLLNRQCNVLFPKQKSQGSFIQMNSMTTISNDFPSSRSNDNLNFQKVLLSAQNTSTTTQQQNKNIADTQLTVVGCTDKTSPNKTLNTKVLLMSPFLG